MGFSGLQDWIDYIGSVNKKTISLGLDRVKEVAKRLGLLAWESPIITIGGTNGKGSTVAGLEAIYLQAGYRVGAFTSPYLIRLNEEFRVNGQEVTDEKLCAAFDLIEAAREREQLTPFEFNTLAALLIFKEFDLQVVLLEVGLGGRLDAVNCMDADLAIITSIAIDHTDYLGSTREAIAKEKAGIFRAGVPVVCGDPQPPSSLLQAAHDLTCPFFYRGKDFSFSKTSDAWDWQNENLHLEKLPLPKLALENMSTVLQAIHLMQTKLPVSQDAIKKGLASVTLPGRIQFFPGSVTRIFDVSHNPASAGFLKSTLSNTMCAGKTRAVFSMLADKDIVGTIQEIKSVVDEWYIAELKNERAAPITLLQEALQKAGVNKINIFPMLTQAYQSAIDRCQPGDRVLTFGSFHTVSEITAQLL